MQTKHENMNIFKTRMDMNINFSEMQENTKVVLSIVSCEKPLFKNISFESDLVISTEIKKKYNIKC